MIFRNWLSSLVASGLLYGVRPGVHSSRTDNEHIEIHIHELIRSTSGIAAVCTCSICVCIIHYHCSQTYDRVHTKRKKEYIYNIRKRLYIQYTMYIIDAFFFFFLFFLFFPKRTISYLYYTYKIQINNNANRWLFVIGINVFFSSPNISIIAKKMKTHIGKSKNVSLRATKNNQLSWVRTTFFWDTSIFK